MYRLFFCDKCKFEAKWPTRDCYGEHCPNCCEWVQRYERLYFMERDKNETLRGFSFEVLDNLHRPSRLFLTKLAQKYELLDKDINPTNLLK